MKKLNRKRGNNLHGKGSMITSLFENNLMPKSIFVIENIIGRNVLSQSCEIKSISEK